MPAIRQPLRQRCNVRLEVFTSIPPEVDDEPEYVDEKFIRSHNVRRARRYNTKRRIIGKETTSIPAKEVSKPKVEDKKPQLKSGPAYKLEAYYELVPYLSLAFCNESFTPSSLEPPHDSIPFTHFVKIVHAKTEAEIGKVWPEYDEERELFTLTLAIAGTVQRQRVQGRRVKSQRVRDHTLITENQLLAARDFLCLALPYYSQAHPPIGDATSSDMVHVLITAPKVDGTAADIMSIAACYLTYASDEMTRTVLKYIDDEVECVGHEWRDVIGEGKGVEMIEKVAKWDWSGHGQVAKLL